MQALLFDVRQLGTPQMPRPAATPLAPALTKQPLRSLCLLPTGLFDQGIGFVAGTYEGRVGVSFLPQAQASVAAAGSKAAKWVSNPPLPLPLPLPLP